MRAVSVTITDWPGLKSEMSSLRSEEAQMLTIGPENKQERACALKTTAQCGEAPANGETRRINVSN